MPPTFSSNRIWSMPCSYGLPKRQKTLLNYVFHATKMIPSLWNKPYEERQSHLNMFSLVKGRLLGKLINCLKILNGFANVYPTQLFCMSNLTRTRSNDAKLKCRQIHSDCTKLFFSNAIVWNCNRLPPSVVQCNSIAISSISMFTWSIQRHGGRITSVNLDWL